MQISWPKEPYSFLRLQSSSRGAYFVHNIYSWLGTGSCVQLAVFYSAHEMHANLFLSCRDHIDCNPDSALSRTAGCHFALFCVIFCQLKVNTRKWYCASIFWHFLVFPEVHDVYYESFITLFIKVTLPWHTLLASQCQERIYWDVCWSRREHDHAIFTDINSRMLVLRPQLVTETGGWCKHHRLAADGWGPPQDRPHETRFNSNLQGSRSLPATWVRIPTIGDLVKPVSHKPPSRHLEEPVVLRRRLEGTSFMNK